MTAIIVELSTNGKLPSSLSSLYISDAFPDLPIGKYVRDQHGRDPSDISLRLKIFQKWQDKVVE